jgi:hypothetical protein
MISAGEGKSVDITGTRMMQSRSRRSDCNYRTDRGCHRRTSPISTTPSPQVRCIDTTHAAIACRAVVVIALFSPDCNKAVPQRASLDTGGSHRTDRSCCRHTLLPVQQTITIPIALSRRCTCHHQRCYHRRPSQDIITDRCRRRPLPRANGLQPSPDWVFRRRTFEGLTLPFPQTAGEDRAGSTGRTRLRHVVAVIASSPGSTTLPHQFRRLDHGHPEDTTARDIEGAGRTTSRVGAPDESILKRGYEHRRRGGRDVLDPHAAVPAATNSGNSRGRSDRAVSACQRGHQGRVFRTPAPRMSAPPDHPPEYGVAPAAPARNPVSRIVRIRAERMDRKLQ